MNLLRPFAFDTLAYPGALLLLTGVLALLVAEVLARAPGVLCVSTGGVLAQIRGRRIAWLRHTPAWLRAAGLALLVVALAGPLRGYAVRADRVDVVDVLLCVDVSGSMGQADFVEGNQYRSRLYMAKKAIGEFIRSRKPGAGTRQGVDRLGLVLYAGFAWTQCPLTLDYAVLEHELGRAKVLSGGRQRDGTAIGSALGLAVRRLDQSEAKSKVIILLTDGLNNRGELDPITAAGVAQRHGIRVYTVGAGATESVTLAPTRFSARRSQPMDEAVLKRIAAITGGVYYHATDVSSLQRAYAAISALEATTVEVGGPYEYRDGFVPYVLAGTLLLFISVLCQRCCFEVIP